MLNYKTVNFGTAEETIKRSRFIASVANVCEQDEASRFIEQVRDREKGASCNPYAYILRKDNFAKYSDDGELSGSAGLPILDVLKREGLTDCCVVITRYYGGVKLGSGGLLRAFASTAKLGIDAAGIVNKTYCFQNIITVDYKLYQIAINEINKVGINTTIDYGEDITITTYIPHTCGDITEKLTDATNGNVIILKQSEGIYINA